MAASFTSNWTCAIELPYLPVTEKGKQPDSVVFHCTMS